MNTNNSPDPKDFHLNGMYTLWNLPQETVSQLDTWELWQPTKEELSLALYKVMKTPIICHTSVFKRRLLHKGKLYQLMWQNDSAKWYFDPQCPRDTRFIVSIRAKDDMKVALIQRRWTRL